MSIQQFFYELWNADQVNVESVEHIEKLILESRKDTFVTIWDSLSLSHKKTLQLVVQTGARMFSV